MEEYRKIKEYINYSVSNMGNVRNDKSIKILKHSHTNIFVMVTLHRYNTCKQNFIYMNL